MYVWCPRRAPFNWSSEAGVPTFLTVAPGLLHTATSGNYPRRITTINRAEGHLTHFRFTSRQEKKATGKIKATYPVLAC